MNKYRVIRDLQGGEFGMGRDYTAEEWLEQAYEWRESDNSWGDYEGGGLDTPQGFLDYWRGVIKDGKEQELIDYVADVWSLEFEKVKGTHEELLAK